MSAKNTCVQCLHFRKHYVIVAGIYLEAMCGHCVYPRLKHRDFDTPACSHFSLPVSYKNTDAAPKTETPNS